MPGEIWPIVRPIGLYNGDAGALGGEDGLYFLSSVDIIPSEPKEARSSSELSIILYFGGNFLLKILFEIEVVCIKFTSRDQMSRIRYDNSSIIFNRKSF
jgi:hypothetical protein